jgi:hypothetical protein
MSKINGVTDKVKQNINREQPKNPTGTVLGHLPPPCLYHPRLFLMAESFSSYEKQDSNTSLRPSPNNSRSQVQKVISTILK